ncbi:MAG: hypothetical protein DRP64_00850 [Verrucomicrobia bacterium]|nr:MAG: hypothetical protein DRP64_00850 [Verrucomicrobiota bacterium]
MGSAATSLGHSFALDDWGRRPPELHSTKQETSDHAVLVPQRWVLPATAENLEVVADCVVLEVE